MKKTEIHVDIAVLGGGASGIIAAICAKKNNPEINVMLIEKEKRIAKKLLSTGNGRCNLSNTGSFEKNYYGSCADDALKLFKQFDSDYIKSFFLELGLVCRTDDAGRVYPYSNQASSVLNVLRMNLESLNVSIMTEAPVTGIKKNGSAFVLSTENTVISAKKLIITTGGISSCKSKTEETGLHLLNGFSLKSSPLFPSLAPVKIAENIKSLKNMRAKSRVSLLADSAELFSELGEVQFSDSTLSGICVFNISRFVNEYFKTEKIGGSTYSNIEIKLDLMPDIPYSALMDILSEKVQAFPNVPLGSIFTGLINEVIGRYILKDLDFSFSDNMSSLKKQNLKRLAAAIKGLSLTPSGLSDFNNAQVTAGGIHKSEINFNTLESKRIKNLYFAGEIADLDGLCGGYNLHWAWVSGILAGKSSSIL